MERVQKEENEVGGEGRRIRGEDEEKKIWKIRKRKEVRRTRKRKEKLREESRKKRHKNMKVKEKKRREVGFSFKPFLYLAN
jgi:hypothetical protein